MEERWLGKVTRDEYDVYLMVEHAAHMAGERVGALGGRFKAELLDKPPGRPLDFVRWLERHGPPGMEVLCMKCDDRLLLVPIDYDEFVRHGLEEKGFDFETRAMEAWNRNEQAHTCKQCSYTWPGLTAEQVETLHRLVHVAAPQIATEKEEAGLADTRLAGDEHDLSLAPLGLLQIAPEHGKLLVAADEGGKAARTRLEAAIKNCSYRFRKLLATDSPHPPTAALDSARTVT
jgi:hypothetical protein